MRNFVFIFLLLASRIFSQVNPPDLRCVQIIPSGDVKLTWIAATTASATFFSYEIYRANSLSGPYALFGTVGSITTNTFIDNGAPTATQPLYYYMKIKSGSGGTTSSISSDTLKTIFLNLLNIPGAIDTKITYNNIHQPKLATTASTFSILKEYPLGTWSILGTSANLIYADTISVCTASINYQVSISDNSGCISNSRILGGLLHDISAPDTAQVDSISVLPNGQTIIAWRVPRQTDIVKYQIYLFNGTAQTLAVVPGRLSNAYTYTTTSADTGKVSIFVAAIDSCNNPGGFDKRPTTMFLKTTYDRCAYQTKLTWNDYVNLPKGILEYRIYYSENGAAFQQIGATTSSNFVHDGAAPGKNLCYFVRVINKSKTITASSNRSCFFSSQVQASNFVYIKTATIVDKNTAQLKLLIDTTIASVGIDIYRSINDTNYTNIGFIPYSGSPNYSFMDDKILANTESYFYKAIVKDSCGNQRTISNKARTILLKVINDKEQIFTKHLSWNEYLGFAGGVGGYAVYRIVNDASNPSPIGYTDPQTMVFKDNLENEAAQGSKIEYLVEAIEGIGNPYFVKEISKSNLVSVYMEGRLYVPSAFAPAGENKTWLPVTNFIDKTEYHVKVFNRWGSIVFEANDDTKAWDGSGCSQDTYVYLINYKNARGEYQEVKGTILLLR